MGRDGSCGACGEQAETGEHSCPRQRLTTSEAGLNPSSAFCSLVPGHYVYNNRGSFTRQSKEQLIRNRAIRCCCPLMWGSCITAHYKKYTWKVSISHRITSPHIIAHTSSPAESLHANPPKYGKSDTTRLSCKFSSKFHSKNPPQSLYTWVPTFSTLFLWFIFLT